MAQLTVPGDLSFNWLIEKKNDTTRNLIDILSYIEEHYTDCELYYYLDEVSRKNYIYEKQYEAIYKTLNTYQMYDIDEKLFSKYKEIFTKVIDFLKYYKSTPVDEIIDNIVHNIRKEVGCHYYSIIVGGSYVLKRVEKHYGTEKDWTPGDVDIFLTGYISFNATKHIIERVFKNFEIINIDKKVSTVVMPFHNIKIQLIRLTDNIEHKTGQLLNDGNPIYQLDDTIDISITKCFMYSKTEKILLSDDYITIDYNNKLVIVLHKNTEKDIKTDSLTFYPIEEDTMLYKFRKERLKKYISRGYINVVYQPKVLSTILEMYHNKMLLSIFT
jgi:hypothetical protein